jgi:hypothetical protein
VLFHVLIFLHKELPNCHVQPRATITAIWGMKCRCFWKIRDVSSDLNSSAMRITYSSGCKTSACAWLAGFPSRSHALTAHSHCCRARRPSLEHVCAFSDDRDSTSIVSASIAKLRLLQISFDCGFRILSPHPVRAHCI